jgi:two-component system, NtrC family, response regulator HydG
MSESSVLVVDDSAEMVVTLARYLGDHGWQVRTATGGAEALELFSREPVDVVLTDLRMKGTDGIDVLEGIHRADPLTPVVLMTAFGSVESAVEAIQRGAHHYVTKPFKLATVRVFLERAVGERRLREQNRHLRATFKERFAARGLVGDGPAMRELAALIDRVAHTSSPVLIVGETGTGKELVARAIHVESDRRDASFVAVSCAALPEAVLESELFGHAAGAFLGASQPRRGLFTEADGGTIFLDEVADFPLALQGKLLRVLESGEVPTVGDDAHRIVDVRCIASTNADLAALVRARTFREDLFFRLDVIPIRVPPLRERREDIPLLVDHIMSRTQERTKDSTPRRFTPEALHILEGYGWPGNVRELENVLQRVIVTTTRPEIDGAAITAALSPVAPGDPADALAAAHLSLEAVEDRYVDAVLRQTSGNKASAATILGVDVSTLYRRARHRRQ